MARQPAIDVGLFLPMAFHAKSHFKLLALDAVHGLDVPMALLTGNFFFDVPLVIEQHVFGQVIGLDPRC